jgi:hypothetical protein
MDRVCPECGRKFQTGNPRQVYDRKQCKKRVDTRKGLVRRAAVEAAERRAVEKMRRDGILCVTAKDIISTHGERLVQMINDVLQGRRYFSAPHLDRHNRLNMDSLERFKIAYREAGDRRGKPRR